MFQNIFCTVPFCSIFDISNIPIFLYTFNFNFSKYFFCLLKFVSVQRLNAHFSLFPSFPFAPYPNFLFTFSICSFEIECSKFFKYFFVHMFQMFFLLFPFVRNENDCSNFNCFFLFHICDKMFQI